LITTGKSPEASWFSDATPSGSDVFFVTGQSLLRADTREDYDIYDARVGGGFASQNEPVQPPACRSDEACVPPLSEPPAPFSVASAALVGPGNLAVKPAQPPVKKEPAKCKKGSVRKHGKCVRKSRNRHRERHGTKGRRHGRVGK
jgi:hypothetical protein